MRKLSEPPALRKDARIPKYKKAIYRYVNLCSPQKSQQNTQVNTLMAN